MDRLTVSPPLLPVLTPGTGLRGGAAREPHLLLARTAGCTSTAVLISEMAPVSSGVCNGFGRMTFLDFSGTWVGIQLIMRPRAKALQSIASVWGSLEHKVSAGEAQTGGESPPSPRQLCLWGPRLLGLDRKVAGTMRPLFQELVSGLEGGSWLRQPAVVTADPDPGTRTAEGDPGPRGLDRKALGGGQRIPIGHQSKGLAPNLRVSARKRLKGSQVISGG